MPSEGPSRRTAQPDGWPEMFPDPQPDCNHQFHWDGADGVYRCMYCNDTREEPK
jgi:hypothetical protein